MLSLTKSLVLLALAVSHVAQASSHVNRGANHHGLARRQSVKVAEEPVPVLKRDSAARLVRRSRRGRRNTGRCSPRSSTSSATPSATPTDADIPPVEVAPSPTSSSSTTTEAAPATSSTPSTTTSTPAPSPSSNEPFYMTGNQIGDGTFYATGLGACGVTSQDTDLICAVSEILFDGYPGYAGPGTNPNLNPVCGRQIVASYGGNTVTVTVVDRCTGCNETSLDFSPSAFDTLADPSIGRIHGMQWHFI